MIFGSCLQTDVVDEIATVKFVFIIWVGERVKPMTKGKISTHKSAMEKHFSVSFTSVNVMASKTGSVSSVLGFCSGKRVDAQSVSFYTMYLRRITCNINSS